MCLDPDPDLQHVFDRPVRGGRGRVPEHLPLPLLRDLVLRLQEVRRQLHTSQGHGANAAREAEIVDLCCCTSHVLIRSVSFCASRIK